MKLTLTAVSLAVALAACGKVQEAASEKAAEKMIESAISKDGQKATVDITGGGAKITTTDASGKTSQMEMGSAKVTEADLGVPFYPGTQPAEGQATRVTTPDGTMVTVGLLSPDAPDKVAAFYRDKLKAQSEGKQFMDMSDGSGGTTIMLNDDKTSAAVQVHVQKADQGSEIQIVASHGKAK
jgi:hypothetical protein